MARAIAPAIRDGLALPHAIEAEREVLAAAFIDSTALDTISEAVKADDFYQERHGLVFKAMLELHEGGTGVDPITVAQQLKDRGWWEKAGGARTLGELLDRTGSLAHLEHYCEIVSKKAMIRRMIEAARKIETEGLQDIADVEAFLDEAEQGVFGVLENRGSQNLRHVRDVIETAVTQLQNIVDAGDDVTGTGTGFRDLDKITHGFQPGDLVILAARPAMGKTSFVLNLAANAALRFDATVALFSLEMPSEQLVQRLIAAEGRLDLGRMRGGRIFDDEWPRLMEAADRVSNARIYLDDTPAASPTAVRAKCRRLKRQDGRLDLVIIDYLQLMSGGTRNQGSREQEISYISRSLKALAKELGTPVIALSQLNRGLESRTDKRPLLSDLRESGAIEQDADIICFIYREEVYKKDLEESERGIAELIIGKHRNGPTGTVRLKFWHSQTRFDNLAENLGPPPV
ncbi:MAG: replicative DNA helicase [Deltaproteobacteria bacterium]|nr:MAG: replicative DNA helicase [Deltaproteobacteria bacterium]